MKRIRELEDSKYRELYRGSLVYLVIFPSGIILGSVIMLIYMVVSAPDYEALLMFSLLIVSLVDIPLILMFVFHYTKRIIRVKNKDDRLEVECIIGCKKINHKDILDIKEYQDPIWRRINIYYQDGNKRRKVSMFYDDLKKYKHYRKILLKD